MIYIRLFIEFFKTGLFAVGGGLATLPFLHDIAQSTGWYTEAQLADMIAVSESTPGPLGVNMATYVGYTTAGLPGALASTLGLIAPSIIIILIIAAFLNAFKSNKYVQNVFYGLRPASTGLIAASGISVAVAALIKTDGAAVWNRVDVAGIILAMVLLYFTNFCKKTKGLHPIVFILGSAIIGIGLGYAGIL